MGVYIMFSSETLRNNECRGIYNAYRDHGSSHDKKHSHTVFGPVLPFYFYCKLLHFNNITTQRSGG